MKGELMDTLYLYEIATNREGFSHERVYVFANSDREAMTIATEKFQKLNQFERIQIETQLYVVSSVEVNNGYCSEPSDWGLKTI